MVFLNQCGNPGRFTGELSSHSLDHGECRFFVQTDCRLSQFSAQVGRQTAKVYRRFRAFDRLQGSVIVVQIQALREDLTLYIGTSLTSLYPPS